MSNETLAKLCSDEQLKVDREMYRPPILANWSTEIYSFGRCWREQNSWPRLLPVPVSSDHGVQWSSNFESHENQSHPRTHLTWSQWREHPVNQNPKKEVVRTVHPWVQYRRSHGIEVLPDALGTIYFLPHSVPGHRTIRDSFEQTLSILEQNTAIGPPFAIMIAMHDVRAGVHLELEKFGLPIYTAGHSSSPFFVDRFYSVVRGYRRAACSSLGSEVFLLEELGVPAQLIGPKYIYAPSVLKVHGAAGIARRENWEKGFRLRSEDNQRWRQEVTELALGIDVLETNSQIRALFSRRIIHYLIVELALRFRNLTRRVLLRLVGGRLRNEKVF